MRAGERIALTVERLSTGGEGVGRADGMVVFVPYAAPSDRLEVEILQTHKRFARAKLLHVLEPSKDRTTPPCPYHFQLRGLRTQDSGQSSFRSSSQSSVL